MRKEMVEFVVVSATIIVLIGGFSSSYEGTAYHG